MKNECAIIVILSITLFVFGCVSSPTNNGPQVQNGSVVADGTITSNGLTISTSTTAKQGARVVPILPAATSGQEYNALISVTGGAGPYGCYPAPGTKLPGELVFSEPGCSISGTAPTLSAGTPSAVYPLSFVVVDSSGKTAGPITFNLIVNQASVQFLFTAGSLPDGTVGQSYSYSFVFDGQPSNPSGGQPPYSFILDSGVGFPPIGLALSPDGTLTGTPRAAGTSNFGVCAVDQLGNQKCAPAVLTITNIAKLVYTISLKTEAIMHAEHGSNGHYGPSNDMTFSWEIPKTDVSMTQMGDIFLGNVNLTVKASASVKERGVAPWNNAASCSGEGSYSNQLTIPVSVVYLANTTQDRAVGLYVRFGRHTPEWVYTQINGVDDNGCSTVAQLNQLAWLTADGAIGGVENTGTGALSNSIYNGIYNAYFVSIDGGISNGDYTKLVKTPEIPSSGSITLNVIRTNQTE